MRPYIICHMGTSIEADGWIVGRKTMAEMAKGQQKSIADAPKLPREARIGNRAGAVSAR